MWGIITSNPAMCGGVPLFHANHANLNTDAGSGPALAGLGGAGMAAMARQKELDGVTVLNVRPRYLVVPVASQLTDFQRVAPNLAPAKMGGSHGKRRGAQPKRPIRGRVEEKCPAGKGGASKRTSPRRSF